MRLTKKMEAEILKVYNRMWQAYMKGDMKTFASCLHDKFQVIGTAEKEIFRNKKAALKFYTETADQITNAMQMRNRDIRMTPVENNVMINEYCDLFALIEKKWNFYGAARITTLFTNTNGKWQNLHQHGSFPDTRAGEGEQISTEKIKKENLELKDAVKRRTIELEEKNRDLEIETSLEKVRAAAMSMQEPDDILGVCKLLYQQLLALGFDELRNALIHIFNDEQQHFHDYDYSKLTGGAITILPYSGNPVMEKFIKDIRKGKKAFSEIKVTGKQLTDWKKFRKANKEADDPRLNKIKTLYYYIYSVGGGSIGISTFSSINEQQQNILKRFRNVFDLAYKRYVDITNAVAQAREAEIELALERVRSKTMSMHQTGELQDVIHTVHNELLNLKLSIDGGSFIIINDDVAPELKCWGSGGTANTSEEVLVPHFNMPFCTNLMKGIKKGPGFFTEEFSQSEKKEYFTKLFKLKPWSELSSAQKKETLSGLSGYTRSVAVSIHTAIFIINHHGRKFTEAENDILKRFAKVFEQTYTRFLDLQKAEAQAREAQIEAALERVRASAMAMHNSSELEDVVKIIREQMGLLGQAQLETVAVHLYPEEGKEFQTYYAIRSPYRKEGNVLSGTTWFSKKNTAIARKMLSLYHSDRSEYEMENQGKMLDEWQSMAIDRIPGMKEEWGDHMPEYQYWYFADFSGGTFALIPMEEPNEEAKDLLRRTASVFDLAYRRYLDLQKAEAQARESEIQLALERVRARTMAMHKSEELASVASVLFYQLQELNLPALRRCLIGIVDEKNKKLQSWHTSLLGDSTQKVIDHPIDGHPVIREKISGWRKKKPFSIDLSHAKLKDFIGYLIKHGFEYNKGEKPATKLIQNHAPFKYGYLEVATHESITEHDFELLPRFAKVFEQTYTRFLDLQKAEAQAREAELQLALERVRARTMAMQKSDELEQVVNELTNQFKILRTETVTCWISLVNVKENTLEIWNNNRQSNLKSKNTVNGEDYFTFQADIDAFKNKEPYRQFVLQKEIAQKVLEEQLLFELEYIPEDASDYHLLHCRHQFGFMGYSSWSKADDESFSLLQRFCKVFEQTYTRFLDLQKAEAQAREGQIQLALERVRARTMAMRKSDELPEAANLLFQQVQSLGMPTWSAGYCIWDEDKKAITLSMSRPWGDIQPSFRAPLDEDPSFIHFLEAHNKGEELFIEEVSGKALAQNYEYLRTLPVVGEQLDSIIEAGHPLPTYQVNHCAYFSKGFLLFITYKHVPESHEIFKRFAKVFEQTYTRFLDLQKAEQQAREAQIEAGLERVRSRTLAMQNSEELAETAAVLFQQLIYLGIAPNRLYIGITEDNSPDIEFWITDEDGSKVSTMFRGNADKNISIKKMVDAWKQKEKSIVIEIHGKELEDYFHYLGEELHVPFKGGLSQKRRWQYIACFSKGFIGMASPDEQPVETIQLLERFAYVFNLTFTRFNDLKVAETHALQAERDLIEIKEARKKAEEALSVLQSTQRQLIQSEKMASLGELAAGIAHEIQNPLNFVNNFSEVNKELLSEMKDEMDKGNLNDAKAIANDLMENEEKINHHGRRADAIVKNMLQHSRINTGQKQLTDINALADEYLRLSYHGFRAKDKSFSEGMPLANATIKTDFDKSIEKINIIPQDIGRVLLNLYNNAFYAVAEKMKLQPEAYEPTVSVSTKKINGKVEIMVNDNGNGIPQNIVDKIFQPFFTTKPTGQGTGLGLSLSYDIVKAHGGAIKVETLSAEATAQIGKEGEGTTFIIQLPK